MDYAFLDKDLNNTGVLFVQKSNDIFYREMVIGKEITNRYFPLCDWIDQGSICRRKKGLLLDLEAVSFKVPRLFHNHVLL